MSTDLQDAIEAAANDLAEVWVWAVDRAAVDPGSQRPIPTRPDVLLAQQAFSRAFAALFLLVTEAQGGA